MEKTCNYVSYRSGVLFKTVLSKILIKEGDLLTYFNIITANHGSDNKAIVMKMMIQTGETLA